MRDKWLEVAVVGFVLGVLARSFFAIGFEGALAGLIFSAMLALVAILADARQRKRFALVALLLATAVGGAVRYEFFDRRDTSLDLFNNSFVSLEGIVATEPDARDTFTFLTVSLVSRGDGEKSVPISGKIRVSVEAYSEYLYGDRIRVSGVLEKPENFETDNGTVFDYRSYLAKDGIYYEMFRPKTALLSHGEGNFIIAGLLRFKSAFLNAISRVIPEPENGLLSGIILGEKRGMPEEINESFRRSGLVHIVVLSGYNLTIIASALMWLCGKFRRGIGFGVGGVGIILFTLMAGASATAVRAAIMAILALLASHLGRDYRIVRALALAGFAMILYNPKVLAFDPSFQLSFLATLGLIYLSPFFKKWFHRIPERFGLREIVSATLATQLFVLPRLIALSGSVSLVGVFANILVLPFVPATMLFGALSGFGALAHDYISLPFSYIAYFLLHGFIRTAEFFGSLPLSSIAVSVPPAWFLVAVYLALFYFVYRLYARSEIKKQQPKSFSQ